MIKSIEIKEDYICFFAKEKYEFKPVTLLVGDQGCGKSTMLEILRRLADGKDKDCFKLDFTEGHPEMNCMYFDTEKGNPAIQDANPNDGNDMLYKMQARMMSSHGETLLPILEYIQNFEDTIILLDEPETALSLRSQYKMIEIFKECVNRGCQVIVATHNLEFMRAFPDGVLSLEHKKYVTPEQFVKLEQKENDFKEKRQDKWTKKYNCRLGNACECTKESSFYDQKCLHYVDREGKSGYKRRGRYPNKTMQPGDFKNG